jgi:SagB-type dehydrogenase family enzyme
LDRPDLEYLVVHDQPLARVMEERETRYEYDSNRPISLSQLGEFLYRVARVRSLLDTPVNNHTGASAVMQLSNRPYPAGGRIYELEFYLAVNTTLDLAPGLYHYDPLGHHLVRLRPKDATVEALLRYTTYAAPKGGNPQVLIVLAARFQRMSWKYDSIAYAATLKHVGILLQSMYLVATAMNLAPCALGSGDSEAFAEAAGTDYLAETSVGEFMLGTARPR